MSIKKISLGAVDASFRLAMREAYDYICQFADCPDCQNVQMRPETMCQVAGGVEVAHGHGRRKTGGRWHPDNCILLCHDRHRYLDQHEAEKWDFWRRHLGDGAYEMLVERMRGSFRYSGHQRVEISKHYRDELRRIEALRRDGEQGYIEIVSYD
jgi:hypothetical protein